VEGHQRPRGARALLIDYTNWRGERKWRRIKPTGRIAFESTEWHPKPQWLLYAWDEANLIKGFALTDIHEIRPLELK
jgi:hypothetical protein